MTLQQYIHSLRLTLPVNPTLTDWAKVEPMLSYARAVAKGPEAVKTYRDGLVAKEINKEVNRDTQIAILFNKDTEPEEYQKYQELRITCKARVDEKLATLQTKLDKILEEAD